MFDDLLKSVHVDAASISVIRLARKSTQLVLFNCNGTAQRGGR